MNVRNATTPNEVRVERHPARSVPAALSTGFWNSHRPWWAAGTRVRDDEVAPQG